MKETLTATDKSFGKNYEKNYEKNYGVIAGIVIFASVFIYYSLKSPGFLTRVNLIRNIIMPATISAVISLGMTLVMSGGGIDLSISSIAGLAGMAAAVGADIFDLPVFLIIPIGLLAGALIGALNGTLVAYFGISPFVVTLSIIYLARGLQYVIALGAVSGTYLMLPRAASKLGGNPVFHIGISVLVIVILVIFHNHSIYGRYIKAIGSNIHAAKYSGIPTRFYTWITYVICGLCCAIGGIMLTFSEGMARVGSGESYQIDAFLLPILGNTIFGHFSVQGTIFSSLFLYMITNGLFILGTPPQYMRIIKGALLVTVILVSGLQKIIKDNK